MSGGDHQCYYCEKWSYDYPKGDCCQKNIDHSIMMDKIVKYCDWDMDLLLYILNGGTIPNDLQAIIGIDSLYNRNK